MPSYPKTCPHCGTEFIASRRDQVYCSRSCKTAASMRRYRRRQKDRAIQTKQQDIVQLKMRWFAIIDEARDKGIDLGQIMR